MALSTTQKFCIIQFLGWPAKTLQVGSTHYSKVMADRLENLPADSDPRTIELLDRIEKVRKQIEDAACRLSASKVGEITTNENEIEQLRALERKWLRELSEWVDIPMMKASATLISKVV